jgi:biopolymer transport protein ExbD
MAKVKVKKQSTFIDMTAMSDVTVLLLTFFMLTSTFGQKEPVTVNTPASVSEIKVPESNSMTILVNDNGKIFITMDNKEHLVQTAQKVGSDYQIDFTPEQIEALRKISSFGVPARMLPKFLDLKAEERDKYTKDALATENNPNIGIPNDSVRGGIYEVEIAGNKRKYNEFQNWVRRAREVGGKELKLSIKADKSTSYEVIKNVMSDLRILRENKYLLVTTLRTASSD